jgi:transmembrane sensor
MDYNPEELIVKFISETLTGDEEIQLNEWRATGKNNELFEELINKEHLRSELAKLNKIEKDSDGVKVKARQLASIGAPILMMNKKVLTFKYLMAAASVVAVLSVGAIIYVKYSSKNKPAVVEAKSQAERFKNDVQPAKQSSILELSDGRKVFLDSASNGNLANQGKMNIKKIDDEIIYEFSKSTSSNTVGYNTMTTTKGDQQKLVLSDGSLVWMNAQSSIRFPTSFIGTQRVVEVTGELFFEVAKNKSMPFIVRHGDVSVEVTGTKFNCNFYDEEAAGRTTLLTGAVTVKKGNNLIALLPGQQAEVNIEGQIKVNKDADLDEIIAWKNGVFEYSNISIENLMTQLQRWYDIEVKYDKKVNTQFGVKVPRSKPISKILNMLEKTGDIRFKIEANIITVVP